MEPIDIINKYWQIITAIVLFIVSFANLKFQNKDQEGRICRLEGENRDIKTTQQSIDTKLAQIQVDIEWIKQALKK